MTVVKAAELIARISNPKKSPRAILVHGADRSAVYELCQRVVKKISGSSEDPMNVARLTEAQIIGSPGRLQEEFASISMFGGKNKTMPCRVPITVLASNTSIRRGNATPWR